MNKQNITNGEQFHNFMLFGANYPYLFIEHCWKDKGAIMTHLRSKFHGSKSFTDFWFMLDSSNRDILGDYISKWGMNDASFDDDYEASVNLAWNDVKEYIASSWQKEFYWNICVTEPCKTPLGKSLAKALGEI
tara:strand:+ start:225 stop:623 length:399 start_codon:yes stop_codon:yes gene_type:complete